MKEQALMNDPIKASSLLNCDSVFLNSLEKRKYIIAHITFRYNLFSIYESPVVKMNPNIHTFIAIKAIQIHRMDDKTLSSIKFLLA